jgi:hypothetical protein
VSGPCEWLSCCMLGHHETVCFTRDLRSFLSNNKPQPSRAQRLTGMHLLSFSKQAAEGLCYVTAKGLVHRLVLCECVCVCV